MPEPLLAEDRQRCRDTVRNAFDVDVDHLRPIGDAQFVEERSWRNAGLLTRTSSLPYRSQANLTRLDKSSRCLTSVGA